MGRIEESPVGEEFDLLVVGGGITGVAVARDAALRGLAVVLLERGDLASGTSSATSRLIHGGYRYLAEYDFSLVRESLQERAILHRLAPHLVRSIEFILPTGEGSESHWKAEAGLTFYDLLAFGRGFARHRSVDTAALHLLEPGLSRKGSSGGIVYFDAETDDARLVVETALGASGAGARVCTHAEVTGIERAKRGWSIGFRQKGEERRLGARVVVLAAGVWSDRLLASALGRGGERVLPSAGSHVSISRHRLPIDHAVVLTHPADGRKFFALPRGATTVLGTTERTTTENPDEVFATAEEVDYLLAGARSFFPSIVLTREDVLLTTCGVRPLGAPAGAEAPGSVSREHRIDELEPGLFVLIGGKLTTHRKMAEDLLDRISKRAEKLGLRPLRPCRTAGTNLPGGQGAASGPEAERGRAEELHRGSTLDFDSALRLVRIYGGRAMQIASKLRDFPGLGERLDPGLPHLAVEIEVSFEEELAETLADAVVRRLRLLDVGPDAAKRAIETATAVAAKRNGWTEARTVSERAGLDREIERMMRFRRRDASVPCGD